MNELYDAFLKVAATDDEAAMHAFLQDHMTEFPEKIQEEILFEYFQESVNEQAEQLDTVEHATIEGLKALKVFEKIKKGYEESQQIEALRASLKQ